MAVQKPRFYFGVFVFVKSPRKVFDLLTLAAPTERRFTFWRSVTALPLMLSAGPVLIPRLRSCLDAAASGPCLTKPHRHDAVPPSAGDRRVAPFFWYLLLNAPAVRNLSEDIFYWFFFPSDVA